MNHNKAVIRPNSKKWKIEEMFLFVAMNKLLKYRWYSKTLRLIAGLGAWEEEKLNQEITGDENFNEWREKVALNKEWNDG